MIRFVRIQTEELPLALQIYNYYSLHSTATFRDGPVTADEFPYSIDRNSPAYPLFLIKDDDNPVGFCGIRRYRPNKAYDRTAEVTIYLVPEYTGRGIGKTALAYLEECARDAGIRVLLGIITGGNIPSIRLFERMGYSRCAHLRNVGEVAGTVLDVLFYQKEV